MLTDDEIMAQVLEAFQQEQSEHRQAACDLLLELERSPDHPQRQALLDQLFREAHSLKGGARAAGIDAVEQMAHRVEDLFSAVRQGLLAITPEICDPIYTALDAIGAMMNQVAAGQLADLAPYQPVLESLTALLGKGERGETLPPPAAPALLAEDAQAPTITRSVEQLVSAGPEKNWDAAATTVRLSTTMLDQLLNETGELITCSLRARQHARDARALTELPARWRRIWRQSRPAATRLQKAQAHRLQGSEYAALRRSQPYIEPLTGAPALAATDIQQVLAALAEANTMIADLEQRLMRYAQRSIEDHVRLAAVTDRLHDQVRRTRMLPLTTLFSPLRVQVREMARTAGKRVVLDIDDGGAEADRQVLEQLREVMIHLLRNAIDHGIEPAEARTATGKQPEGRIALRARVSGDRLTLTVADDGQGLDMEAIRAKALSLGQLKETDLGRLGEAELSDMIFTPGFSTRQTVSTLSGRGVGLDIVRCNVERMHGRVSVASVPHAGCTFTLSVPLSLTSSHGLLLQVGGASYLLPLDAIQRIVSVLPQDMQLIEGRPTLIYGSRPLTLVHLSDLLGDLGRAAIPSQSSSARLALLLGSGERQVACVVDAVLGEQELVVQRLPAPLRRVRGIAGATILADGSVVPILDAVDLLRAALGARRSLSLTPQPEAQRHSPTVLVVDDSITTRTLEKNILEAAGYKVVLATDGAEALQLLGQLADSGGCNLLLSDVDMPRLSGFELTAQVRADARLRHLPVVLVTSLDTPADRERGIAAGADAYIVKRSFDQHTLLDTIAGLL